MNVRTAPALIVMACTMLACSGPTGTGTSDPRLAGTWQYHAGTTGTSTAVDGVLVLTVSASGGISGSLEATESDATGRRTPIAGLVSGSVVGMGSADFQVVLVGGHTRQHLASVRGDSLVGDWIEGQAQGAVQSGRFGASRKTP
jgi:hypothetical protein